MTATGRRSRSWRMTSMPSRSGMTMSSRTMSGLTSSAFCRASSPPLAVTTLKPSSPRAMDTSFVIRGSSSATRTRGWVLIRCLRASVHGDPPAPWAPASGAGSEKGVSFDVLGRKHRSRGLSHVAVDLAKPLRRHIRVSWSKGDPSVPSCNPSPRAGCAPMGYALPRRPHRASRSPSPMYFDEFKHQLPDIDPAETEEWLSSLDQVVEQEGETRARFLVYKLLKRARQLQIGLPPLTQTRYINTISPEQEPNFPGDEAMELRIRRIIRWNAVAMVLRANTRFPGIGGHLSTYASSASLYETGFNHFFRGKDGQGSGDQVFFQGHAAPGMYARAFLEGRISESQLDHFRREVVPGEGLSSYPHPRLMPDFWEYPTVSMGLGPISAIYQARYNRYLQNRGLLDTSGSRVWAFLGDGESDEPESLGALHVAAREGLDNL